MRRVIVIGAGAAGMMAAIMAARLGCKVTILERTSRCGRKIEITGNGKCNFTNANQDLYFYHTRNREYLRDILDQFSYEQTLDFFEELGIVPRCKNGYYYPYSGQAQAVSQALRMEAERLRVKFACNIKIENIKKEQMFYIKTEGYHYTADAVILAAGSKAAPSTGSDGSGYTLAKKMGHKIRKPLPALVQLLSLDKEISFLAGLRTEGTVTLVIDGKICESESGEIQFVKNGLSGIPIFQISGRAAQALDEGREVMVQVNFLTGTGWKDIPKELEKRRKQAVLRKHSVSRFFNGLIHERAAKAICSRMEIRGSRSVDSLNAGAWEMLLWLLQEMEFKISGTGSFEQAQVCSGGVCLEQLKERTLESRLVENLYFAGEILDVDGACGGYNLQWAWASGYVSGIHAAKD